MLSKFINFLAVVLWVFLASFRLRLSVETGSITPLLLAVVSGMIAFYLIIRNPSAKSPPLYQHVISGMSVFAPVLVKINGGCASWGEILVIIGSVFTIWALYNLRQSFGIAPADRGIVKRGPYNFIRHPMYAGELVTLLGATLGCFSLWNMILLAVMFLTFYLRISWEEKIISGYQSYKNEVKWRLLPGIW